MHAGTCINRNVHSLINASLGAVFCGSYEHALCCSCDVERKTQQRPGITSDASHDMYTWCCVQYVTGSMHVTPIPTMKPATRSPHAQECTYYRINCVGPFRPDGVKGGSFTPNYLSTSGHGLLIVPVNNEDIEARLRGCYPMSASYTEFVPLTSTPDSRGPNRRSTEGQRVQRVVNFVP